MFSCFSWSSLSRTDKTPSQDATDGARLENGLTQTPDSQEEIKESEEDIKESQEEIKESEEAKEVTKPGRKNVRQASKKDTSSTQTTGKASGISISLFRFTLLVFIL